MSSAEREELRQLVEQLPDSQLPGVLADVRRHLTVEASREWPPSWFGAGTGRRTDTARRVDDLLAEGFGRTG
jgi:hypothetical protein